MFAEAVAQATSKEEWNLPQIQVNERERLHDTFDPKVKEHLIWLSTNWSGYFKEAEDSSSSATSWSKTSSWWDQSWSDRHQWKEWQKEPGKNKVGGNEIDVWC